MLGFTLDLQPQKKQPAPARFVVPRRRQPRNEPYAIAGIEPAMEDLFNDPVMCALMRRDGVNEGTLRMLLAAMRATLRGVSRTPRCFGR